MPVLKEVIQVKLLNPKETRKIQFSKKLDFAKILILEGYEYP